MLNKNGKLRVIVGSTFENRFRPTSNSLNCHVPPPIAEGRAREGPHAGAPHRLHAPDAPRARRAQPAHRDRGSPEARGDENWQLCRLLRRARQHGHVVALDGGKKGPRYNRKIRY